MFKILFKEKVFAKLPMFVSYSCMHQHPQAQIVSLVLGKKYQVEPNENQAVRHKFLHSFFHFLYCIG